MKNLLYALILAFLMWFFLFWPPYAARINFWPLMMIACASLAAISLHQTRDKLAQLYRFKTQHIYVGIGSSLILYLVFVFGHKAIAVLFHTVPAQVTAVYQLKQHLSPAAITVLLLFGIGPAEEIFWRGFLQHTLSRYMSELKAVCLGASIYSLVHIWSLNAVLIIAAFVCGVFWGVLFARYRSLWPVIISHAVWDVLIFVLMPLG